MKRLTWKKNHAPLFLHPLPRRDVLCSWVSPRGGGRRPKVFMSFVGENEPRLGASHGDLGERACFRFPGIGIDFDLRRSRRWRSADHVSGFGFAAWPSLLASRQSPRFPSGSCSFPLPCHPRGAPGLLAGRRLSSAASPGHLLKLERGTLFRCQGRGRPRPLCPAEALPESPAERARETRSEHRESPGRKPGVPLDFPGT